MMMQAQLIHESTVYSFSPILHGYSFFFFCVEPTMSYFKLHNQAPIFDNGWWRHPLHVEKRE